MPRFSISSNNMTDDRAIITGDDVRHINKVLRLNIDDEIILFDDLGNEYISRILNIGKTAVETRIVSKYKVNRESPIKLTLLQALTKGDKMDLIVQKATELGVEKIVPVVTVRSYVRNTRKIDRWQKIADESIKQCARNLSPKVHNEEKFEHAVNKYRSDLNILFFEINDGNSLNDLQKQNLHPKTITLVIGPEGGFTNSEALYARNSGYYVLNLGPRVLRSETASITALAIIQYIFGDI